MILDLLGKGVRRGFKSVATGNAQANMGLQSPHVPNAVVRLGRFFQVASGGWILAVWYTGYANMRTEPGSGPKLVLPGKPIIGPPDRSLPAAKWANSASTTTSTPNQLGGAAGGLTTTVPGTGKAAGFLPGTAQYTPGRKDQGRDGQTNPGGPIIAPGAGVVLRVASDPNGFGPDYPIVKFSSGPYAGRIIYIGHTHSQLHQGQRFSPNQILSYTGRTPVGNASVPGWFEIGYADGGNPGPFGQPTPF